MNALRGKIFLITTCVLGLVLGPVAFAIYITRIQRFDAFTNWCSSLFMRLLQVICGLSYEIRGLEHLPATPPIIASRHESFWETMLFFVIFRQPIYVVKQEVLNIPVVGPLLARRGSIGIDRRSPTKALRMLENALRDPQVKRNPIIIFPEGSRTKPGHTKPFQRGVSLIYRRLNRPCTPVALNSGHHLSRFWDAVQPGCIILEFLPAIPPGLPPAEFLTTVEKSVNMGTQRLNRERATGSDTPTPVPTAPIGH